MHHNQTLFSIFGGSFLAFSGGYIIYKILYGSEQKFSEMKKLLKGLKGIAKFNPDNLESFIDDFIKVSMIAQDECRYYLERELEDQVMERRKYLKNRRFHHYMDLVYHHIKIEYEYERKFTDRAFDYLGLTSEKINELFKNPKLVKLHEEKLKEIEMNPTNYTTIAPKWVTKDKAIEMYLFVNNLAKEEPHLRQLFIEIEDLVYSMNKDPHYANMLFIQFEQKILSDTIYNKFGIDAFQYNTIVIKFKVEKDKKILNYLEHHKDEKKANIKALSAHK